MYANMSRFTIEVADPDTGIYISQAVVDHPNDAIGFAQRHYQVSKDGFRMVEFKQDKSGVYYRADVTMFEPVISEGVVQVASTLNSMIKQLTA